MKGALAVHGDARRIGMPVGFEDDPRLAERPAAIDRLGEMDAKYDKTDTETERYVITKRRTYRIAPDQQGQRGRPLRPIRDKPAARYSWRGRPYGRENGGPWLD